MDLEQRVEVLEGIFARLQDYYTSAYSGEEIDARLASAGVPIGITKEYQSVQAMNQDFTGADVQRGQFVLILPDSTASADYGKVYLKGTANWVYAFTLNTLTSIKGPIGPPGRKGDKGNPGEAGSSFVILGYFGTLDALKTAVPNPKAGDMYGVGTAPPYNIYAWDAVHGKWVGNGNLQGPEGKSAFQTAVDAGYTGSEAEFNAALVKTPGHISNKSNPHGVTPAQIGAYTKEEISSLLLNKAEATDLTAHTGNKSNPHGVTAKQIGAYSGNGGEIAADTTVASLVAGTYRGMGVNPGWFPSGVNNWGTVLVFRGGMGDWGVVWYVSTDNTSYAIFNQSAMNSNTFDWIKVYPKTTAGTTAMTSGTSALATGEYYNQYE